MRYSDSNPLSVEEMESHASENAELFARAGLEMKGSWAGAILLVGGNDWRSMALRRAQSALRFDRRPSYWSHAALVLDWNERDPSASWGVEVSLEPEPPSTHVPEHNGVTTFRLARYLDRTRWVNLCVAALVVDDAQRATAILRGMREAALEPHRRGVRFPLWDWLAAWTRYSYASETSVSPLHENVPMPSAALVELALDAAEIAAAPGATDLDTSPETLWCTVRHWHDRMADGIQIRAWRLVRDELGTVAPAKPLTMAPAVTEDRSR